MEKWRLGTESRIGPRASGTQQITRTSRVVRLTRATHLVATILAHGKTATLSWRRVAARTLADRRPFGLGERNASVEVIQLLVNLARPPVAPPVRALALRSVSPHTFASARR